nr:odorant receptor [Semanotus bifasciatus]
MFKVQKYSAFYSTLTAFALLGQIPREFDGSYSKSFLVVRSCVRLVGSVVVCIGPVMHYVMAIQDNIEVDISENISIAFSATGALLSCTLLSINYRKWLEFFADITNHKTFGKPSDYEDLVKRLNRLSAIYVWYCALSVPIYGATAHFDTIECDSAALKKGFFCRSFTPIWLPIDASDMKLRVIIFAIQMVIGGIIVCTSAVVTFLTWESTEMLISHINHLKTNFGRISGDLSESERCDLLEFCIQYHNHILRLANRLNGLIKHTSGHMSLMSAIIFAAIANQISKSKSVGAMLYLVGYFWALFFICHAGQRIRDEIMSIGDAAYNSQWYATDVKTMKNIRFVIARSQIQFHYEAIPMGVLDYPLFLAIIKTAYSYVTVLSQTT